MATINDLYGSGGGIAAGLGVASQLGQQQNAFGWQQALPDQPLGIRRAGGFTTTAAVQNPRVVRDEKGKLWEYDAGDHNWVECIKVDKKLLSAPEKKKKFVKASFRAEMQKETDEWLSGIEL